MTGGVREFRLVAKLKNNILMRLREEIGLTPKQAAEQMGVTYSLYLQYEAMTASPVGGIGRSRVTRKYRKNYHWRPSAVKIAEFFGVLPDKIWPDSVLSVRKSMVSTELSFDEVALFIGSGSRPMLPDEVLEHKELAAAIKEQLMTLTEDERSVLEQHFGICDRNPKPRNDCDMPRKDGNGNKSPERIRQIEERALRKLRRKEHSKKIKEFIEQ